MIGCGVSATTGVTSSCTLCNGSPFSSVTLPLMNAFGSSHTTSCLTGSPDLRAKLRVLPRVSDPAGT